MAETEKCTECGADLPADAPQGLCPKCLIKLGLPTGAETDKTATPDDQSNVPTNTTPPARFVPPEPAELADQFPQLEIFELLGQGGMGAVYKARQKQLDRLVALKILPPEIIGQAETFAERFTREARSLARLNHPHIVTVHDFGRTEKGLYYFIMEFVDGTDLRRLIQAGELLPQEALAVVPQVCEALQYAHEEGVVHRDIKPENILLDKKGRVRIADFGLAKLLDQPSAIYTLTQAGQKMGTPHYMAPEQFEKPEQVDHRADIYSLGVVFYEMLTGELPIGRFAPPSKKVKVDVRLDEVVLRSLEKEPELRYQQASEVKTDVETISSAARPALAPVDHEVSRMEKHVTVVAVINIAFGTLGVVGAVLAFLAIAGGGWISQDPTAIRITSIVATLIAGFLLLISVPEIIGGIGLIKRRPWARILVLIIAVLDLLYIPIGTAIGIYELWVLLKKETAELFSRAATRKKIQTEPADESRNVVRGPAIGLLVTGIINWVGIAAVVLIMMPLLAAKRPVTARAFTEDVIWWVVPLAIALSSLIIFAALKMMRLQAYRWAVVGSILAMITSPGNIIGLPIGVWALVVLTSPQVKAAFTSKPLNPSVKKKWNGFSAAAFGTSLTALAISLWIIFSSIIHDTGPRIEVHERVIWIAAIIVPTVFACVGLRRHSKHQDLKGKGLAIVALLITFATLVAFFATFYYPVT